MLTLTLADLQHLTPAQQMVAAFVASLPFAVGLVISYIFMEAATSGDDNEPDGFA